MRVAFVLLKLKKKKKNQTFKRERWRELYASDVLGVFSCDDTSV